MGCEVHESRLGQMGVGLLYQRELDSRRWALFVGLREDVEY
jgi:hypothetical protein